MPDYETMRRGLSEAMGWTNIREIRQFYCSVCPEWSDYSHAEKPKPFLFGDGHYPCNASAERVLLLGRAPDGEWRRDGQAPDPLNRAEDAEALVDWLEGQGYDVGLYACWVLDRDEDGPLEDEDGNPLGTGHREACCSVFKPTGDGLYDEWNADIRATDEPNPASRRRRALVEAAWQAVQATQEGGGHHA